MSNGRGAVQTTPQGIDVKDVWTPRKEENIRIIKERPPEVLHENLQRNLKGLVDFFVQEKLAAFPTLMRPLFEARVKKKFAEKSRLFYDRFQTLVFDRICHWSAQEIADGTLKSPELLARERGLDNKKAAVHSGDRDREIGNTDYVFGNATSLRSRSGSGEYQYHISDTQGYAVPLDIGVIKTPDSLDRTDKTTRDNYVLDIYAKNLYTLSDFKTLFATYCAVVFETPEEAITFFNTNRNWPDEASFWRDNPFRINESTPFKKKIRSLILQAGVLPPVSPEFQFKDQVQSERVIVQSDYSLTGFSDN